MKMMKRIRRLLLPVLVFAIGGALMSCNSRWFRQATRVAGEEAAYAALESVLPAVLRLSR